MIELVHIRKEFPGGTVAVEDLSLTVDSGEVLVLVGPSGCGKSTALRMIAGLEKPTAGMIAIGGEEVQGLGPRERDLAMVFQNYALYPHLNVFRNVAFPLKERRVPKPEIERRVREVADMLELSELLKRKPGQLSGGQRQRVAMARALVREPRAFLLDEPLSNLDAKLRAQVRGELKSLLRRLAITSIYVTHDQVEAMTLGDRIAVLDRGRLQQLGTPDEVFDRPANLFVAAFMGSPPMNLLRGRAEGGRVTAGTLRLHVPGVPDGDLIVGFRPEALKLGGGGPALDLHVEVVEPLGTETLVHGSTKGELVRPEEVTGEGEELPALAGARAAIAARLGPRERPAVGERVALALDVDGLHVFDARTGRALGSDQGGERARSVGVEPARAGQLGVGGGGADA
jgi:sn-glycerol 3-phosphate transport system ATP-binding protein